MHKVMVDLHQDHVHLARLLDILDQQVEILSADGDPDLALMSDIARYVQHYPDLVHHPKEDMVFEALKQRTDDARPLVESLMEEHRHLPAATMEFHEMLEAAASGAHVVKRDDLHKKIQEFIKIEREHMNAEEKTVFPLIHKVLTEEDWDTLDKKLKEQQDPLFGKQVEEQYENLYRSIKDS